MQMPSITDPIDPKRASKNLKSCLNTSSVIKAGFLFFGTLGVYYLTRTKNIFSYFGLGAKNSKDVGSREIMEVKSIENALSVERKLETIGQTNSPPINRIEQMYKNEGETVEFEEIKVKNLLKIENEKKIGGQRRSISISNPIPNQNAIVGKPFELMIDGNNIFSSSNTISLEATNIPAWLTSSIDPELVRSYDIFSARAVTVSGDYAYVTDEGSQLQIIDISNPLNPIFKSSYNTYTSAYGVFVSENYAYVTVAMHRYASMLEIVDVSDPSNPTFKGSYDTSGFTHGVVVSSSYAYVADGTSGLQIINITDSANPTFKGSYNTPDHAFEVAVSGNYAYVADFSNLLIIDISNPANPTFKSSYDTPGQAFGVALFGDYAYVADGTSGLQIIDINNPANPIFKGSYDTPGNALKVALSGVYAYVADEDSGLQIIDISDLTNPISKGSCDTPDKAYGIAVSGNYAYVADDASGLQIIDLNLDKLTLSGTPSSVGTYGVDIEACNEMMECVTDSFEIVAKNSLDAEMDLSTILAIIIPSVGACIICTVSLSLLIIVGGIVIVKRRRKEVLKDKKSVDKNECKEEKELQKMDIEENKKVGSSLPNEQKTLEI
jgi:hypothetical protein